MKKLALLFALTAGLAACGEKQHDLTEAERQTAELGARQYAGTTADLVGVSGLDSNNDGYVTATIRNRAAPNATTEIVCSYRKGSTGCKLK